MEARVIKIAITALGGQGGGVLADWIVALGERAGFIAQSTSVPGVAQRTGATVYYVELFPASAAEAAGKTPVLALMPTPGDVDIVLAAELMEAGRAVMRGFVSGKTTLIASTHRDYAIGEKSAMGEGRRSGEKVLRAAKESAGVFIAADMQSAAASSGAVISAAICGALAGSGALPIHRKDFEEIIRESGRAVENNLEAFAKGFAAALSVADTNGERTAHARGVEPGAAVRPLLDRMRNEFPAGCHGMLMEGLRRVVDYQDTEYGEIYLDRVKAVSEIDRACGGETKAFRLTALAAKHVALWMTYEDAIRVAELKTRASRFARIREDVRAADGQIIHVSEYFHPRVEEVCDLLPAGLAKAILSSAGLRRFMSRALGGGRRISTTKLRGFLLLTIIASLRGARRGSYRFGLEEQRIKAWLAQIAETAPKNYDLACEALILQRLIKGYGETHERGLANFNRIFALLPALRERSDAAKLIASLHQAALADEEGRTLGAAIREYEAAA